MKEAQFAELQSFCQTMEVDIAHDEQVLCEIDEDAKQMRLRFMKGKLTSTDADWIQAAQRCAYNSQSFADDRWELLLNEAVALRLRIEQSLAELPADPEKHEIPSSSRASPNEILQRQIDERGVQASMVQALRLRFREICSLDYKEKHTDSQSRWFQKCIKHYRTALDTVVHVLSRQQQLDEFTKTIISELSRIEERPDLVSPDKPSINPAHYFDDAAEVSSYHVARKLLHHVQSDVRRFQLLALQHGSLNRKSRRLCKQYLNFILPKLDFYFVTHRGSSKPQDQQYDAARKELYVSIPFLRQLLEELIRKELPQQALHFQYCRREGVDFP